jgi:class 3 adenylate cyclase
MSNPALADVLASYVPKLIQNRVAANPSPIDAPDAEDFQASVLFADISGFTLLTERLAERGPSGVEALARNLNEYFGQLIDIIHEYGGDVVKFAGGAVIAVWRITPDTPRFGLTRARSCFPLINGNGRCALRSVPCASVNG